MKEKTLQEARDTEYCWRCGWHKTKHPKDCQFESEKRRRQRLGIKE